MRFSEILLTIAVVILAALLMMSSCRKNKPIIMRTKCDTSQVDSLERLLAEKPQVETVYEPTYVTETTTITDSASIEKLREQYEARMHELNEKVRYYEETLDYIASSNDSITIRETYNQYDFEKSTKFYDFRATIQTDGVLRPDGFTWQVLPKIPTAYNLATASVSPRVKLLYAGDSFVWGGGLEFRYKFLMAGVDIYPQHGVAASAGLFLNIK
jgi:hypothetical protein